MGYTAKDMSGQKFGKLTVLKRSGTQAGRCATWLCACDCGNEVVARGSSLRSGRTTNCGCYHSELMKAKLTKHDGSRSKLYKVWTSMKQRCLNHKDANYHHYGGRGIKVCDEWMNDFQSFHDWAMANGYDETSPRGQCTLDRIDNNGNYCPENCRWTTMSVQNRNQRPRRKSHG